MPTTTATRRLLLLGALALVALLLAGVVTGAVGAAFFGDEAEGLIPQPAVHLPPQPIYPLEAREHFLKFEEGHEKTPFEPFQFFISNTLLSAWITSLLLLLLFGLASRRAHLVPRGLQNLLEMVVEALLNFVEGVIGREWGRRVFPVIATIFLFVAFNAWIGLLPIYPSLGFIEEGRIAIHLLRPAGTDLNLPLALALISFVFVESMGIRALGVHYLGKFIRLGSLRQGLGALVRGRLTDAFQGLLDFFFVGPLELFSELVRIISFTFRLFGNMTAGEILVLVSAFLVSFIATIGVYALEILVGFVQALIFAGLTLVFVTVAITPHEREEH
ncbi:MAG: F0F1 ATP synthase subunit A [Dehalococcoidia bacterium]